MFNTVILVENAVVTWTVPEIEWHTAVVSIVILTAHLILRSSFFWLIDCHILSVTEFRIYAGFFWNYELFELFEWMIGAANGQIPMLRYNRCPDRSNPKIRTLDQIGSWRSNSIQFMNNHWHSSGSGGTVWIKVLNLISKK